ncbi:MAG: DNA-binding response regulator [Proteobacteria bacterium]|nr:MAG: DNA-binding response regulator [Pseudomonadota bacterium]
MKLLIVDDESLARSRLRGLVEQLEGWEVVGEAANGRDALGMIESERPDIVLLDIRMPGMDGLEAARHMAQLEEPPAVIFTTAYGDHALAAFEAQAVDYLLKPIRRERLAQALGRAQRPTRAVLASLHSEAVEERARTHLCARYRGALELVPVADVIYFQADQKYVTVRHAGGSVLIEESLKSLEEEFGERFLRIHRNALVAEAHMGGLESESGGHAVIAFRGIADKLEVSRRHLPAVRRRLRDLR